MYNVELYVEQCIRSLYDQDIPFEEFEVIIIDDCSSDNSIQIVKELQKEFPRLHLLVQPENRRQGAARNIGIGQAHGNYVWFIDSDDYINANVFRLLLKEAEQNNVDILQFNFEIRNKYGEIITVPHYELDVCSGADFVFDNHERWNHKIGEVCRWIIRKNFIIDNKFYFEENVQFEDTDYAIKLLAYANRVKHLDLSPYCYRKVETSTTNSAVSILHLKYKVLMTLRFAHLIEQLIKDARDIRFIPALKEFINFEIRKAYSEVCKLNGSTKKQFAEFINEIKPTILKKHLFSYRYFLFSNRVLWISTVDLWETLDNLRNSKKYVKKGGLKHILNG